MLNASKNGFNCQYLALNMSLVIVKPKYKVQRPCQAISNCFFYPFELKLFGDAR